MKRVLSWIIGLFLFSVSLTAQVTETFDISTFQTPKGWSKQAGQNSYQISTEDKTNGAYCLVTLFKSMPGVNSSKQNFDAAWQTVVRSAVNVSTAPQMAAPENDDGWEVLSGFAPFEKDGAKGVAILVTATGFGKMVNSLILTNSDAYEKDIASFLGSIVLKKPVVTALPSGTTSSQTTPISVAAGSYGLTSTKFDDGWTSTAQGDWVHVVRNNTAVLIHYPNKNADAYNSVVMDGLKNAWNVLVAPRYVSGSNFEFKPITGWQTIEFAEADMTEKGSGKNVHVVLFKMNYSNGTGRYLEFITPNKAAFEQEFGAYHQTTSGWEKLEGMANYNKFGITAADLKGKWTNDFSGSLSYVNAYTGAAAGTDTHASIESFSFGPGGTYNWEIGVASGMVGNIKFQSAKSSGRVSVSGIWQLTFSNIEGKPRTYNAQFSAIKGGRILWVDGKAFAKLN